MTSLMLITSVNAHFHVQHLHIFVAASAVLFVVGFVFAATLWSFKNFSDFVDSARSYARFFYASFLKPHTGDHTGTQQDALESFYQAQADVYDTTRKRLLNGREDMLGLVAAQLGYEARLGTWQQTKPIWVDVGGGTGWNIEAMQVYLDVPNFFSAVYLVDLSPSLCKVSRARFARLGWENVHVVCEDARQFELGKTKASLITMSYSLSMMPNFHSIVDGLNALLDPNGLIGVIDFYVQSGVETCGRNYIGGSLQRHVNWLGRTFWRSWFDLDRVGLEGARRDYLEYRFGTLKSIDERNYILGGLAGAIPYYIFLGRLTTATTKVEEFAKLADAESRESPYLSPSQHRFDVDDAVEVHSKAYESAIVNLSANLPLPSTFYQNLQNRICYDESLAKHTQFNNDFIYAFTWEDSRVDQRLLKIDNEDVVLCLTSAGDNLLDYILTANPRRVHAVDLNPSQNHLLELKVAAYQALPYSDFWRMFGEGKYAGFRDALIRNLSPYMSSQALQFWLSRTDVFTSPRGLYERGGSGRVIRLVKALVRLAGLRSTVTRLCDSKTLNEQREIWPSVRRILMSRPLQWAIIGSQFLWDAAGVPPAQAAMILQDHLDQESLDPLHVRFRGTDGEAVWQYLQNTFDPIAQNTLIREDNFYYLLALTGKYTRRCHPPYLSAKAHARLSKPSAFTGLRIHTDEINEVISRIAPGTLTIAVVMDSMDWFDPQSAEATSQIRAFNRALKLGGRVLLRSAGLKPWYASLFEALGFSARRVGIRLPGTCIDRVNMYSSTWIMYKRAELMAAVAAPTAAQLDALEI